MKNILVLPHSVPGGGKSTFCKFLLELALKKGFTGGIFSTDSKFISNGIYNFDAKKLGYNHGLNQKEASEAMASGLNMILIDNCNLSGRDTKPYIEAAKRYNYVVVKVSFIPDSEEIHHSRNIHGVPLLNISTMIGKFHSVQNWHGDIEYSILPEEGFKESPKILEICNEILNVMEAG